MLNYSGLGDDAPAVAAGAPPMPDSLQSEIDGFLAQVPDPTASDVAGFLKLYPSGDDRDTATQALLTRGVDPSAVSAASNFLDTSGSMAMSEIFGLMAIISAALNGYHGVRRNNGSVGWGVWWFTMGALFPIVSTTIAIGQGFGRPKVS